MTKLLQKEAFSMLQPENTGTRLPPAEAAHALFITLRSSLEQQPWDPAWTYSVGAAEHYTRSDFSRSEMTIKDSASGFEGNLTWLVEGPADLTLADRPVGSDRVEEKLYVHSPDWRQQASLEFTRNIMGFSTVNLDSHDTENTLLDLLFVTMSFEANAPNDTDRLRMSFDASSGFTPRGNVSEATRVINGAPALYDAIDQSNDAAVHTYLGNLTSENLNPRKDDIAALRTSVALLRNALMYLRQNRSD